MPSINNLKSEINEELARDKIILEHIQHRYEEEERRFQTVDGKINSMIAVLAGIFTLQASVILRNRRIFPRYFTSLHTALFIRSHS